MWNKLGRKQFYFNCILFLMWIPTVMAWLVFAPLFRLQCNIAKLLNGKLKHWNFCGVRVIPNEMPFDVLMDQIITD